MALVFVETISLFHETFADDIGMTQTPFDAELLMNFVTPFQEPVE